MDVNVRKPYIGRVKVTPKQAEEWLGINRGNRRLKPVLVEYLAKQITNGQWQEDHPQGIVFSDAGRLIDGQHRLTAIVTSGKTVSVLLICGVRDGVRDYIDSGINRTLEDRVEFDPDLRINRFIARVITTCLYTKMSRVVRVSPEEAKAYFNDHMEGVLFAAKWLSAAKTKVCRAGVCVALLELFERDQSKAEEFAADLLKVDGETNQARVLRDFLLRSQSSGGHSINKEVYGKSVMAMKAFLEDRKISIVKVAAWDK